MDFLQSAEILIPALTEMPVTIYIGQQEVLHRFEKTYCFSAEIQEVFTAKALYSFLEKRPNEYIYEIREPMGTRLTVFKAGEPWILLGPYVNTPWNEKKAKDLFATLHLSLENLLPYQNYRCSFPVQQTEFAINTAFLLIEHTVGDGILRQVKTIETTPKQGGGMELPLLETYEDSRIVNRRYHREKRFMQAVRFGEANEALKLFQASRTELFGLRFSSNDMRDQLAMVASMRTLIRKAAEQAGLTPVVIDAISQDYAVQMQHTASVSELYSLLKKMVIHICNIIQQRQCSEYSIYLKKATEYIDVNLGRSISATELAEMVGISSNYFVKKFSQETGMTIKQYITKRRCEVAADLLTDSRISIQEIAAHVGYEDRTYFARVFKEWSGVSPQKYRAKYGENIQ